MDKTDDGNATDATKQLEERLRHAQQEAYRLLQETKAWRLVSAVLIIGVVVMTWVTHVAHLDHVQHSVDRLQTAVETVRSQRDQAYDALDVCVGGLLDAADKARRANRPLPTVLDP